MRFGGNNGNKVDNHLKTGVVFYCKDCDKIVNVTPVGRKFVYRCNICKTKNVAFGSDKSIKNFYHLPDETLAIAPAVQQAEPVTTAPVTAVQGSPDAIKTEAVPKVA